MLCVFLLLLSRRQMFLPTATSWDKTGIQMCSQTSVPVLPQQTPREEPQPQELFLYSSPCLCKSRLGNHSNTDTLRAAKWGGCRNTSHLHSFSGKEKEKDSILQQGRQTENHCACSGCQIHPAFPSSLHVAPCNHAPYQGIDIFHLHGPTMEDVSAQHNE